MTLTSIAPATTTDSAAKPRRIRVALAGNPNCGKTSLFNALTGARQHVANYPGVTVEKRTGAFEIVGETADVVDLPGTYSLSAFSPEERVAEEELASGPDVVVVVADSMQLQRNLVLLAQVLLAGANPVLCLNMADEARAAGQKLDVPMMEKLLGIPVVETVASRGQGLHELLEAVRRAATAPLTRHRVVLGEQLDGALGAIAARLPLGPRSGLSREWTALRLLLDDDAVASRLAAVPTGETAVAEARRQRTRLESETGRAVSVFVAERTFGFVDGLLRETRTPPPRIDTRVLSDRLDDVVAHRYLGLPIFGAVLYGIFWLTFTVGEAPMGWIEAGVGSTRRARHGLLARGLGVAPEVAPRRRNHRRGRRRPRLSPEHPPSLPRPRPPRGLRLHGPRRLPDRPRDAPLRPARQELPPDDDRFRLLGPRDPRDTDPRERARPADDDARPAAHVVRGAPADLDAPRPRVLPARLAGARALAHLRGGRRPRARPRPPPPPDAPEGRGRAVRHGAPSLPHAHSPERRPQDARPRPPLPEQGGNGDPRISILLWAATSFPKPSSYLIDSQVTAGEAVAATDVAAARAAEELEFSVAGRAGRFLEPAFAPLGFDWKMVTAMIGAFAAKEVFVAQMGIVYSIADTEEGAEGLRARLARDYSPLVGVSLILFLLISAPCMATIAVTKRESGRWRWALLQLFGLTAIAWLVSFLVYQGGRLVA
ncbi:MAG: 50S ribosome-binding GTPase [Holophagales bacterium]|nr:50S ribosome-binding GTPase [Holophagales bacterium]